MFPRIRYIKCELEELNNYNFVVDIHVLSRSNAVARCSRKCGQCKERVAEITIRGVTAAPKYPSADSLEDIEGMR